MRVNSLGITENRWNLKKCLFCVKNTSVVAEKSPILNSNCHALSLRKYVGVFYRNFQVSIRLLLIQSQR